MTETTTTPAAELRGQIEAVIERHGPRVFRVDWGDGTHGESETRLCHIDGQQHPCDAHQMASVLLETVTFMQALADDYVGEFEYVYGERASAALAAAAARLEAT